jgi:hypothetical protein
MSVCLSVLPSVRLFNLPRYLSEALGTYLSNANHVTEQAGQAIMFQSSTSYVAGSNLSAHTHYLDRAISWFSSFIRAILHGWYFELATDFFLLFFSNLLLNKHHTPSVRR